MPQGDRFLGDAIFQVVVPLKLIDFENDLKTAHDMVPGHLDVKRTHDKISRYFYWPRS